MFKYTITGGGSFFFFFFFYEVQIVISLYLIRYEIPLTLSSSN